MSQLEYTVEGTLNADGTLALDRKPNLSPGRVTVVLRQQLQVASPTEDWFQHLLRIRAERESSGYPFMNEASTIAHIEWLREEDRINELLRDAKQPQPGQ